MKSRTLVLVSLGLAITPSAWAFGIKGTDGFDGRSGYSGEDGDSPTLFLTGQPANLDLRGTDASDGNNGQNGGDAYSCTHDRPAYNITGAEGGQGGDAGRGGRGGDGGEATLYYTDPSQLQQMRIDATPGRGGRSGYPAEGGRACVCQVRSWVIRQCHIERDPQGRDREVCRNNSFYCTDGRAGSRGNTFYEGGNGRLGSIRLIQSATPLGPELTRRSIDFARLDQSYELSKHVWLRQSGARGLLASGSRVADDYVAFDRSKAWTARFEWNNRRPFTVFAGSGISLSVAAGAFTYSIDSDVWAESDVSGTTQEPLIVLGRAVRESEAGQVAMKVSSSGRTLHADVTDSAQVSDQLDTRFTVKYQTHGFIFSTTRFEGEVPASLIDYKDHAFTVRIGELPIDAKYLAAGEKVTIKLSVIQSLAGHAKNSSLTVKQKLQ